MSRSRNPAAQSLGEADKPHLSTGQCATLACLLEVSAPKPGNVHRSADFEDLTLYDFLASAVAIAPAMQNAARMGVGSSVLEAVRATRRLVQGNTNLGTVLLLAPLAAVPRQQPLREGLARQLQSLDSTDAAAIYQAIRLAEPGGLGRVDAMDLGGAAPASILEAMQAAAAKDLVARQYISGFATVLDEVVPALVGGPGHLSALTGTIVHTHVQLISRYGDSLIARKCGPETAREASRRAAGVLASGEPSSTSYLAALTDFDFWLRSDHHRRNPGTTADLIAAGLFAALRDGLLATPR